jgi:hypothetical protein
MLFFYVYIHNSRSILITQACEKDAIIIFKGSLTLTCRSASFVFNQVCFAEISWCVSENLCEKVAQGCYRP